ncbi:TPA: nucleotidyltransferase domain-containing protein, partial [bacterium]|nr:nucleotidyltransferase domain-containing protein [bacterium]
MASYETITKILLAFFPEIQAAYIFGSYDTEFERDESDIDVAILLPPEQSKTDRHEIMIACSSELALALGKSVDLVHLRLVDTVFQR